ncbi:MAG: hypothetical protein PHY14_03370 [Candidatus Gracilibacteria bacterium]|nr:hypothetical protein [Candidatus Gracilibacteria bacterium]
MTSVIIDNIPETKKAEYQDFFRTLVREYNLDELEDHLFGLHIAKNGETSYPISELKAKYESQIS